ncbi:hypothetical protein [Desulfurococcus amylolyticus]|uniref:hypothetical protein n=1 Tax=Desulfurococcus amylolyticus TaxID=94694 RepID=UPI0012FEAC33|nr:hypothetical protein [Desulfurococcus amylolyticus]
MKELFIISSYISRLKYLLTINPMKNVINVAINVNPVYSMNILVKRPPGVSVIESVRRNNTSRVKIIDKGIA